MSHTAGKLLRIAFSFKVKKFIICTVYDIEASKHTTEGDV